MCALNIFCFLKVFKKKNRKNFVDIKTYYNFVMNSKMN